jgi:hypothetical protein
MKKSLISIASIVLLCVSAFILRPHISRAQGGGQDFAISQAVFNCSAHGTVTLDSSSLDSRVNLDPGETAEVDLQCTGATGTIHLVAPNGGSINNQGGHINIDASSQPTDITFSFEPGTGRGRYTVEIEQGSTTRILRFWVGAEPVLGQPGPNLTFN